MEIRENLEIVTVNYNTPDLIDRLIKSVRDIEGNYPIRVIDGSDTKSFRKQIEDVSDKYTNTCVLEFGWNIHHARGMDSGVTTSDYEWVLIMDSDNYILQPMIDRMMSVVIEKDKKICAYHCYTDSLGNSGGRNKVKEYPVLYYHPCLFLIKKDYYMKLKASGAGFVHGGAPCINMMNFLHRHNLTEVVGIKLCDAFGFEAKDYGKWVCLDSRGTRQRFGINL